MKPTSSLIHSSRFAGHAPRIRSGAWSVVGQDGGQSVDLGDRTLFVFSDTLLATHSGSGVKQSSPAPVPSPLGADGIFLPNTAAIAAGADLRQSLASLHYFSGDDGLPRAVLEATESERFRWIRFWPEHGVLIDGKVYLFYLGVQTIDPTTVWGFRNVGCGLAVMDPDTGDCTRLRHKGDWRFWKQGEDDLHFGVQTIARDDGFVYVFFSTRGATTHVAKLARVSSDDVANPDAYEFLTSSQPNWSADVRQATSLGEGSTDFSVSYNPYLDKYLLIYVDGGKKQLVLRTADCLWGPYSDSHSALGLPHDEKSELVYLGFQHGKFSASGGREIWVSYSQPNFHLNSLLTLTLR